MADDFDNPWRMALAEFLDPCLGLLFPVLHARVDWSRGYEVLNNEQHRITPAGDASRRAVDLLARAFLHDGTEEWLLVHVEVQTQPEADFARRMFCYFARLLDGFGRVPASVAILADQRPSWRPAAFACGTEGGPDLVFRFPTVKLADFAFRREELERSDNIFAPVILAHLDTQVTRRNDPARVDRKIALLRNLRRRGWDAARTRRLFQLLDVLMKVRDPHDQTWWDTVAEAQRSDAMPRVWGLERYREAYPKIVAAKRSEALMRQALTGRESQQVDHLVNEVLLRESDDAILRVIQLGMEGKPAEEILDAVKQFPVPDSTHIDDDWLPPISELEPGDIGYWPPPPADPPQS